MSRKNNRAPQEETRGGDKIDWRNVVMGEPLPDLQVEYPEATSEDIPQIAHSATEEAE